ncbi:MAG: ATP-binding cassette domain-containing protein [Actinomycetota bacterium]|nr:ATP-binding cassette domain-containing protein [Actinomycetota bacterium]
MSDVAIVAENLGKRFGDVVALAGVDFAVPSATILGLLGPNGAGKTTAVRILTTILRPDQGRALVLGRDVAAEPHAVRATIGLAGQYAAVDENLTGRENLRMVARLTHLPRAAISARAGELLERFDLREAADRPVRTYSGGMRRRLDLAAALVHTPPVLFLDEPTTGLDPRGRNDLWAVITNLVEDGTTVLLTTQYLEEAERLADRIVVIDGGRVIAEGTAGELKHRLAATIVEVRMPDPADAERARTALSGVGPGEVLDDGRTVALTVADAGPALLAAVRVLDGSGLTPEWVTVREPSLDDVFLQLTGHRTAPVRDGAGGGSTDAPVARRGRHRRRGAA